MTEIPKLESHNSSLQEKITSLQTQLQTVRFEKNRLNDNLQDKYGFDKMVDVANKISTMLIQRSGVGVKFTEEEIITFRNIFGNQVVEAIEKAK